MKRKALSILITLCMLLTVIPMTGALAFADDGDAAAVQAGEELTVPVEEESVSPAPAVESAEAPEEELPAAEGTEEPAAVAVPTDDEDEVYYTLTVDFQGYGENVTIDVPKGAHVMDYLSKAVPKRPQADGAMAAAITTKSSFSSAEELEADYDALLNMDMESDMTVYIYWFKAIEEVAVTVEAPVCGTNVTMEGDDWDTQTPEPVVSVNEDGYSLRKGQDGAAHTAFWVKAGEGPISRPDEDVASPAAEAPSFPNIDMFTGKITGGNTYYALVTLDTAFGYYVTEDTTFTVNGKEAVDVIWEPYEAASPSDDASDLLTDPEGSFVALIGEVQAEHVPGEAVKENVVEATEDKDGSYDEVVYCDECGKELSRETVIVPAKAKQEKVKEEKPSKTAAKPKAKDNTPATGDESAPAEMAALMIVAAAVVYGVRRRRYE